MDRRAILPASATKYVAFASWYLAGLVASVLVTSVFPFEKRNLVSAKAELENSGPLQKTLITSTDSHTKTASQNAQINIQSDLDLWKVLLDEKTRSSFLKNPKAMQGLSFSDWITVVTFCTSDLNWSWNELEAAIAPETRSLLNQYKINGQIYSNPKAAWDTLLLQNPFSFDGPVLFEKKDLLERAAEAMAKAEPSQFLKDLSLLPESIRKDCLWKSVPSLMNTLDPKEAVNSIMQQLNVIPIKDRQDILKRICDASILQPAGDEAVKEMLNTLPDGPERQYLEKNFSTMQISAMQEDPLN